MAPRASVSECNQGPAAASSGIPTTMCHRSAKWRGEEKGESRHGAYGGSSCDCSPPRVSLRRTVIGAPSYGGRGRDDDGGGRICGSGGDRRCSGACSGAISCSEDDMSDSEPEGGGAFGIDLPSNAATIDRLGSYDRGGTMTWCHVDPSQSVAEAGEKHSQSEPDTAVHRSDGSYCSCESAEDHGGGSGGGSRGGNSYYCGRN
ncbi:unnamed protein product [Phaeothamnion confervicola]